MTDQNDSSNKALWKFIRNVLIKASILFLLLNILLAFIPSGGTLSRLSLYNLVFPGRVRLPFGENPAQAYNLSLYDIEAMFASHEISKAPKPSDEFRIILIGDSATWGILLEPEHTLSSLINRDQLTACDGRIIRAYNLAYPTLSLAKDLMILEKALTYQPDLILWPVTQQSFPDKLQIETPLVANNPELFRPLIHELILSLDAKSDDFVDQSVWDRTLFGRRRALFDALQLQYYGVMWAATGIDQTYPTDYTQAQRDFPQAEDTFQGWSPPDLPLNQLRFDILHAGATLAGEVPILIVNEPILISTGENSDVRYNFFYPRWAFDQYRIIMAEQAISADWKYVDLWDVIPSEAFTNSAVHLTPQGSEWFYQALKPTLERMICP